MSSTDGGKGRDWGVPLFTPEQIDAETRRRSRSRKRRRLALVTGGAAAVLVVTAAGAVLLIGHHTPPPSVPALAATLAESTLAGHATPTPMATTSSEPIPTTTVRITVRITVTKVSVTKVPVTILPISHPATTRRPVITPSSVTVAR